MPITQYGWSFGVALALSVALTFVVRALIGLMEHEDNYGHVFNIGNNTEISMSDLAKQVREMCNSKSEIVYIPYEKAYEEGFEDMPRRVPDLSRIRGAIGYVPTKRLHEIVEAIVRSVTASTDGRRRHLKTSDLELVVPAS